MLTKKLLALTTLGALVLSGCAPESSESEKPEVPMGKPTPYKRIAAEPIKDNSTIGKLTGSAVFQSTITVGEKTAVDCLFTDSYRDASIECDWDNATRQKRTSEPVKPVYEKINLVPEEKTQENEDILFHIFQFPKEAHDGKFIYCLLVKSNVASQTTCDWKNPIALKD